ncbi:hypothetical protein [Paractinoplanes rishiriensis]|uniref:Uncharacterized protein n=1 Tax=Paractinoplanes rishiriensis TaxID=1050105 RepID=A0A919N154_9ACTN|nr:hypothetical protein [Actinoplanes rishiriensis]GIF00566.1 hypothetical protein Ari01nite_80300 [Actinoplanes rishiriensis]
MAKATPPDGGLSSYRREAAELFAASAQRRRRRAIADPGPIVEIEEAPSTAPARRRRPAPGMSELD